MIICKQKLDWGIEMAFDVLARDAFETLSTEQQAEVVDFILFLSTRQNKACDSQPSEGNDFPFDCFVGGLNFISDDFDISLDDFEEYM